MKKCRRTKGMEGGLDMESMEDFGTPQGVSEELPDKAEGEDGGNSKQST